MPHYCVPGGRVNHLYLSFRPQKGPPIRPIYLVSLSDASVRSLCLLSLSCCIAQPCLRASLPILPAAQSCSRITPLYRAPLPPLSHKDHIRCSPKENENRGGLFLRPSQKSVRQTLGVRNPLESIYDPDAKVYAKRYRCKIHIYVHAHS